MISFLLYVKAQQSLDSMTCTKMVLRCEYQTSRESLVLLETTQSLLGRRGGTLGSFQECWIGNQVKLRALTVEILGVYIQAQPYMGHSFKGRYF